MISLFSLVGKTALVTGGNSGIGRAMATALAGAGASVVIVGRSEAKIGETVDSIRGDGGMCEGISADILTTPPTDLIQQATAHFGDIDILINAAGVNLRQPANEITPQSWDTTLNLNLKTPFFLAQTVAPTMRKNGWGRLINIASLQSERAFTNGLAYGASKGGVAQMTRAMAEAWSADGITANAVAPGFFRTPLTEPLFGDEGAVRELEGKTAVKRTGNPEDLYGTTIFLASRASDYVTGQIIYVDGGWTAK